MGQVLHGSATTTEAVRRSIQHSQESLRVLAKRYGINRKTVAKWKKRTAVKDLPTGPRDAHSTVLSIEEESVIVAFRRYTLLPLACPGEGRGLLLRAAGVDPASDPLLAASLSPAARHQPVARDHRRQDAQA